MSFLTQIEASEPKGIQLTIAANGPRPAAKARAKWFGGPLLMLLLLHVGIGSRTHAADSMRLGIGPLAQIRHGVTNKHSKSARYAYVDLVEGKGGSPTKGLAVWIRRKRTIEEVDGTSRVVLIDKDPVRSIYGDGHPQLFEVLDGMKPGGRRLLVQLQIDQGMVAHYHGLELELVGLGDVSLPVSRTDGPPQTPAAQATNPPTQWARDPASEPDYKRLSILGNPNPGTMVSPNDSAQRSSPDSMKGQRWRNDMQRQFPEVRFVPKR